MAKKKPLTEAQKHKIRVAAAKKAAQTRRANIPEAVKKAKAAEKRARTMEKKRKAAMEEAYQRNLAAKKQTAAWQKRSAAAKKGWETRRAIDRGMKVIKSLQEMISNWTPEKHWSDMTAAAKRDDKNTLQSLLNGAIQRDGEKEVARRLEQNADLNLNNANVILYDSDDDRVDFALAAISSVINGQALTAKESTELSEEMEDLMNFYESTYTARV